MDFDSPLNEVVLFEMPTDEDAERLMRHFRLARMALTQERGDRRFVAVALREEPSDLALLLREVEAWMAVSGLPRLTFELDGRTYSLRHSRVAVAGLAA